MGVELRGEILEAHFDELVPIDRIEAAAALLPEGLALVDAREVWHGFPSAASQVRAAEYEVIVRSPRELTEEALRGLCRPALLCAAPRCADGPLINPRRTPMYAVLMTGGKQYRVEAGSTLVVEKVGGEPGSSITFDRILLVGDGEDITVGSPTVAGASVSATVLGEALGPKIVVFKFKQKVKYRRRTGHRQHLTRLRIDSISADGKTVKAET